MENIKEQNLKKVNNVITTMAIEDMYLDKEFIHELISISKGDKTSEELRNEVMKKYAR